MKYGLIGEKLGHSFSPEIHRLLSDDPYELKELKPTELAEFIQSRLFAAINVTVPYKEAVMPLLDEIDKRAQEIGAVNTIINQNGRLIGYNTDFYGLSALIDYTGICLRDKTVLILGSGGTSKTAFAVAKSLGCREAVRVSRSGKEGCITYEQAKETYAHAEIVINTTPCGMYPRIGDSAISVTDFPALEGVIDAVYNPLRSKLICDARSLGIPAAGGLYMLVAQAACAAELFTGKTVTKERIESIYHQMVSAKQNVVLIGMPGCGKSTVGKVLAEQLGLDFIDTDAEIAQLENRTIPEIFSAKGVAGFRAIESAVIQQIAARQGCVIATGGGAVLDTNNMAALRENGRIYFIDRSLDKLCITSDRPLSSSLEALEQRYHERYNRYVSECDCRIVADDSIENVAKQIREDMTK